VTDTVDLENMNKPGYMTVVDLDDEDEAGLRRTSSACGCRRPFIRLEFVDQELVSVVLNLLDGVEVLRSGEANSG